MTPSAREAIKRLRAGNLKFINTGSGEGPSGLAPVSFTDLSAGQEPFAAVLACADSRVPVEAIFAQGAGDLFVVRVAGNIIGPLEEGSLEFAVGKLGVPVVLIMGHSECGAVGAALSVAAKGVPAAQVHGGSLPSLLEPIIEGLDRKAGPQLREGTLDPAEAVRLNVMGACEDLMGSSELVRTKVESGELLVAGAVYELSTGRVDFLE